MRVLLDIGHPAHVHLFRNPRRILLERGHEVFVMARDKEMARYLLNIYGIDFFPGTSKKAGAGALLELIQWFVMEFRLISEMSIDIVLSIGSPGGAWSSRLYGIPHLAFNDTESAQLQRILYKPAVNAIFTPRCYKLNLGKKQIRYSGYHELSYLRPEYYKPDPGIRELLGVHEGERYTIIRFVSWEATHDRGHTGLSPETKLTAVRSFSRFGKVFISSELPLTGELDEYRIKIPAEKMHDALYYSTLLYGESATMASECSVLGTPAIYLDDDGRGYTDEQEERYGTVFNYSESPEDQNASVEKGIELLACSDIKEEWSSKRRSLLADTIDVAEFIADQTEAYQR